MEVRVFRTSFLYHDGNFLQWLTLFFFSMLLLLGMMDVKTMMLGAVEAASHMGLTKVFLTGTDEDWKPTMEAVSESRRQIKESLVQNPKVTHNQPMQYVFSRTLWSSYKKNRLDTETFLF